MGERGKRGKGKQTTSEPSEEPDSIELDPGDLIITEIMNNPSSVDDSVGEMFAVVLEVTSSVFNDGHGISALIDENVIAVGFEPHNSAS